MPSVMLPCGLRTYYRESGRGDRVVLFLHGNAASSRWWDRVMAGLPEGVRGIALDLRGCGDTDKPNCGWSMADLAEDVYQFVQAKALTRCTLVGHSLGGGVALHAAVAHPEVVERLVLINSAPAEGLKTPRERYAQLEQAIQEPRILKAVLRAMMPTAPDDAFVQAILEESVGKSAAALIPNGKALDAMDLTQEVGRITAPTLILYGDQDPLVSLAMMERTRNLIPGALLEVWKGIGHSPPVEAPERFVQRLASFLEE